MDSLILLVFIGLASALLLIDLVAHRKRKVVTLTSSVIWTLIYVVSAFCFAGFLYLYKGQEAASLFMTGYTLEKVLAFDNLFVFSLIFTYFKIPRDDRHRALHWGIAGAIVFRLIFVALGVGSMNLFGPMMELVFAMLIAFTIYLILNAGDDTANYNNTWYVKYIRNKLPMATPFFIAICVIEVSDILFAFDSVPAIIAVTKDPLLIYSAMIFAILGLRSMYFIIDALASYLKYMDTAIVFVLGFISAKLAAHAIVGFHIEPLHSLVVILAILSIGVIFSLGAKDDKGRNEING